MDIDNLVDTYLATIGLKRLKGSSASPLLPFFILDAMYSILTKDIASVPVKNTTKKALTEWIHAYNLLNRSFFRAFTQDQQNDVIDLMDSFQESIANDIVITKVQVMNQLGKYGIPFEGQTILASAMVCNILAQQASIVWEEVYRRPHKSFVALERHSQRWMQSYFLQHYPGHINPNDDEQICLAVDILCKKIIQFLDKVK